MSWNNGSKNYSNLIFSYFLHDEMFIFRVVLKYKVRDNGTAKYNTYEMGDCQIETVCEFLTRVSPL